MEDEKWGKIYVIILIIISLSIFLFLRFTPDDEEYSYKEEDIPKIDARTCEIYGFDKGDLKLKIDASVIEVPEDEDIAIFKGIKEGVIYKGKTPEFKLKAREIRINTNTKDTYFLGHVIISKKDLILKGNFFFWSSKYKRLTGKKGVEIITDDLYIRGKNFSSDVNMKEVKVVGNVLVNIYLGG